ncbi:MAG: CopD family protein [Pseudomonadota bacterium]
MGLIELDASALILRTLVYAGSIAAAGGLLFYASVPGAANVSFMTRRQVRTGALTILVVEPLRYAHFQMAIAGGDVGLAFDPAMRWMALETPIGQAGGVRMIAGACLLVAGVRWLPLGIASALAMIGSFTLEGHTVAHEGGRWLLAALLALHLVVAHWWLGALVPLRSATALEGRVVADLVAAFGRMALGAVIVLALAGTLLIALLANWHFDPSRPHQMALAAKLVLFVAVLGIAARNKGVWTPMLTASPARARKGLRTSLNLEIGLCGAILAATALVISFSPSPG